MSLTLVRAYVGDSMNKILKYFKPGAKITVLVRNSDPDQDFLMTNDSLHDVAEMIARSQAREGK